VTARPFRPNPFLLSFMIAESIRELLRPAAEAQGLTAADFAVQSFVRANEPITPTAVADLLGMAPTTVSAHVRRMIIRGHARKTPNPDDRRSYLLELTPAGREAVLAVVPALEQALGEVAGELPVPVDQVQEAMLEFEAALRRVAANR